MVQHRVPDDTCFGKRERASRPGPEARGAAVSAAIQPRLLFVVLLLCSGLLASPSASSAQELRPLDAAFGAQDRFGYSVAIDSTHLLIGSPRADDFDTYSGGVTSYVREDAGWREAERLNVGEVGEAYQFGWDVAIDGAYAIVGAYGGAAHIYRWSDTTWTEQVRLTAAASGEDVRFGHAVDISGDYAIVGAYQSDVADTLNGAGAAYIFVRTADGWSQDTLLTAPDPATGDHFGFAVAVDGPYAVVGAREQNAAAGDLGAAYLFERSGEEWTHETAFTAEDGSGGAEFGFSVDISGSRVLVGAWNDDTEAQNAGAAYSFTRTSSGWHEERKWTAGDTTAVDAGYGYSVAIDANTAVIGALRADDSGRAYLYRYEDEAWQEYQTFAPDSAALFGSAVAVDAESGVLIGGWGSDDDTGLAWLYSSAPTSPVARHDPELPRSVDLNQNYPNPFNPRTTIPYEIASTRHVELSIYDARGRLVATPVDRVQTAGRHTVEWHARQRPSGVYFYRLKIDDRYLTRSMILLK